MHENIYQIRVYAFSEIFLTIYEIVRFDPVQNKKDTKQNLDLYTSRKAKLLTHHRITTCVNHIAPNHISTNIPHCRLFPFVKLGEKYLHVAGTSHFQQWS